MIRIGGSNASMLRICTGLVWVRSTIRLPSGFGPEIKSVVLLPRRMLGRNVERAEIIPVGLDMRALGHPEAEIAEDLDDLVEHVADRVDAARSTWTGRQGHIETLGGKPRSSAASRSASRRSASASVTRSFKRLSSSAGGAPGLRIEGAQLLHPLRDHALLAERRHRTELRARARRPRC